MQPEPNSEVETIREFINCWRTLDAPRLANYFTEDGTYHNMPAKPVTGKTAHVNRQGLTTVNTVSDGVELVYATGDLSLHDALVELVAAEQSCCGGAGVEFQIEQQDSHSSVLVKCTRQCACPDRCCGIRGDAPVKPCEPTLDAN